MKILCDENLPHDLRACLAHHDVFTIAYLGWGGIKNGKLLEAAEADGFDILLTGDKTIAYEQDLREGELR